jgi:Bacterial Ig domain
MSERLDQDLARWEEGEISFDEVAARHPVQDARDLRRLRDRLAVLATEPTPEPDPGWAALKEQLADRRPSLLRRVGQRAYRPVLVAAAVTLVTAGLALGLESVRQGAVWFLRTVAGFLVAGAAAISFLLLQSPPTAEDAALSGPEDATVVWNPGVSDEDQDELTCFIVTQAAHGSARVDSDCTGGSYVPDPDFHGKDAFMYRASDGTSGSAPAAVNITVQPVNDDPVAADDGAATPEDTPTTIEVLANDEDVDGNSLESNNSTVENGADNASLILNSVSGARGSVSVGDGGRLTYTPDPNFTGSDSFRYRVGDGDGGSDMGSVLVRVNPVNDPPAATDVSIGGNEDVAVDWVPSVSDVEGDTLTCSIAAPAAHGTADVGPDCSGGSYTPHPDFTGTDSFTYTVSDGTASSVPATVTIVVQPVNDAPVAADDAATTEQGAPITIQVLANDADLDGDPLTVAALNPGANGTVSNDSQGIVIFIPDPGFSGEGSFTYTVSDGNGGSDVGFVFVRVNPVPERR